MKWANPARDRGDWREKDIRAKALVDTRTVNLWDQGQNLEKKITSSEAATDSPLAGVELNKVTWRTNEQSPTWSFAGWGDRRGRKESWQISMRHAHTYTFILIAYPADATIKKPQRSQMSFVFTTTITTINHCNHRRRGHHHFFRPTRDASSFPLSLTFASPLALALSSK